MSPATSRHLVGVWNPSYAQDAMEEHLRILLDLARRCDDEEIGDDQLYVWWGKVRSSNRQRPQAHMDEFRALAATIAQQEETQLYLTDYRSLYVGEVDAIAFDDPPASEAAHVPAYYHKEGLHCDFWFRLLDIRRLVVDDTMAVIRELQQLRNVHYNERPVSLYGGMVDLPLIVTRPDGRRYFDPDERDNSTENRLWAEFDAEAGSGVGAMGRELRDNLLGERAWEALEPTVQVFLATGERIFREHRHDPAFDFGSVISDFAKALEVQCDAVLRRGLARVPVPARRANVAGRTQDLLEFRPLTSGELSHALGVEQELNRELTKVLADGGWFTGRFPAILDAFAEVRNQAIHRVRVSRDLATYWRNQLLGVGCAGVFVTLAEVRPRNSPISSPQRQS